MFKDTLAVVVVVVATVASPITANALEIARFSFVFTDSTPRPAYVADVGFQIDPRTPFDDEWLFGRGDAVSAPGPWVFQASSPASFSAFSNADDANFDAVVARLTNGVDEELSVDFWHVFCIGGGCVFGSEHSALRRRLESEWFGDDDLTGVTVDEIRFDWSPGGLLDQVGTFTVSLHAIPEPSTGALLAGGLVVVALWRASRSN